MTPPQNAIVPGRGKFIFLTHNHMHIIECDANVTAQYDSQFSQQLHRDIKYDMRWMRVLLPVLAHKKTEIHGPQRACAARSVVMAQ